MGWVHCRAFLEPPHLYRHTLESLHSNQTGEWKRQSNSVLPLLPWPTEGQASYHCFLFTSWSIQITLEDNKHLQNNKKVPVRRKASAYKSSPNKWLNNTQVFLPHKRSGWSGQPKTEIEFPGHQGPMALFFLSSPSDLAHGLTLWGHLMIQDGCWKAAIICFLRKKRLGEKGTSSSWGRVLEYFEKLNQVFLEE